MMVGVWCGINRILRQGTTMQDQRGGETWIFWRIVCCIGRAFLWQQLWPHTDHDPWLWQWYHYDPNVQGMSPMVRSGSGRACSFRYSRDLTNWTFNDSSLRHHCWTRWWLSKASMSFQISGIVYLFVDGRKGLQLATACILGLACYVGWERRVPSYSCWDCHLSQHCSSEMRVQLSR